MAARAGGARRRAIGVAAAEGVRAGEGDNLAVIEALWRKDLAQVTDALVAIWQSADLRRHRLGRGDRVLSAKASRNLGPAHDFDGRVSLHVSGFK